MKKLAIVYSSLIFVLLIGCIFVSCGGGGNNGTLPVTNTNSNIDANPSVVNSTPTPVLTNVSVSGYIYANNIVTEDCETVPSINVIDVPAYQEDSSGNEPFISQVANTIKSDYPEDWVKSEVQELYAQLNKTMSESKPLPEYNAQVQVSSVYNDTTIPVGSDGHFDNTVLTGAADSNVKLEVALGEDNYAEVETLPSLGNINSSDAIGAAVLKSCPEKIFAFPGEIVIFKVYSEPGINLKSAGLTFTLNNSSIGCIIKPVYLCLFGAHKYQVAYGCVYIKPGLDTPIDTTITAKLNSGQSLSIFLEVIKKTAIISGTVYTGGMPLMKGYVKSLGPKACCKIDSSGQYSLPKVFMGHSRSVIATWWTSENGQKIKHREEKVIDFLSGDLTGVNFGVPPTPTPTSTPSVTPTPRPLWDRFYDDRVSEVIYQFEQWEAIYGEKLATKKTVDWLNGKELNAPPVPKEIVEASVSIYDDTMIWIYFANGHSVSLNGKSFKASVVEANTVSKRVQSFLKEFNNNTAILPKVTAPRTSDILILAPVVYEEEETGQTTPISVTSPVTPIPGDLNPRNITYKDRVYGEIADELIKANYNVKRVMTTSEDIDYDPNSIYEITNTVFGISIRSQIITSVVKNKKNIVRPDDFKNLNQYGVIFIATHSAGGMFVECSLGFEQDEFIRNWTTSHIEYSENKSPSGVWFINYEDKARVTTGPSKGYHVKKFVLTKNWIGNQDFSKTNPIIYLDCCNGMQLKDLFFTDSNNSTSTNPNGASVFITWSEDSEPFQGDAGKCSSRFFQYMMKGLSPENKPMSVQNSYDKLISDGLANPLFCELKIKAKDPVNTYFPVPVRVIVHKK